VAGDLYDKLTAKQKSVYRAGVDSLARMSDAFKIQTRIRLDHVFNNRWQMLWHVRMFADGVGWRDAHAEELEVAVTLCLGLLQVALKGEE